MQLPYTAAAHIFIESLLGNVEVPDFDPVVPGGAHDLGLVAVNAGTQQLRARYTHRKTSQNKKSL